MNKAINNITQKGTNILLMILVITFISRTGYGQLSLQGSIEAGVTHAQGGSYYYYNEISDDRRGWSAGLTEIKAYGGYDFKKFTFHLQPSFRRDEGSNSYTVALDQANLEYHFSGMDASLSLGMFINPFGAFYNRQFSQDRHMLSAPLQYSFYQDISTYIGYFDGLDESDFSEIPMSMNIDSSDIKGSSMNYRYAYLGGLKFDWTSTDGKFTFSSAIGNRYGPHAIINPPFEFVNRFGMDVSWAFSHGLSLKYSSFRKTDYDEVLGFMGGDQLQSFSQFQVGYDFVYGSSFLEISGELSYSSVSVAEYDMDEGFIVVGDNVPNLSLSSFGGYIDVRYEVPALPGFHALVRSENISHGSLRGEQWDNNVWRNSLLIGYKYNQNILIRAQYSIQSLSGSGPMGPSGPSGPSGPMGDDGLNFFLLGITAHL